MEYRLLNYALVEVVLTPDLSGEMEQEYVFVGPKVNGMILPNHIKTHHRSRKSHNSLIV